MNDRDFLREHLYGVNSHMHVLHALEGLDHARAGARVPGLSHTIHQILRHMIYWQDLALARMRGAAPPDPETAAEGWDFPAAPEEASDWEASIASLAEGLRSIETLVADPRFDLDLPLDRTGRRTPRGQVWMVQGHNSYHLGQIVQLRERLGAWPPPKGGDTW